MGKVKQQKTQHLLKQIGALFQHCIQKRNMRHKSYLQILLVLLAVVILFHVAIIVKIVPYHIAWGGRLTNDAAMYVFETLSISINLLLGFVLLAKAGYIRLFWPLKTIHRILYVFLVVFMLNTIGNLFAKTIFEQVLALVTFVFAFFIWKILKQKHEP